MYVLGGAVSISHYAWLQSHHTIFMGAVFIPLFHRFALSPVLSSPNPYQAGTVIYTPIYTFSIIHYIQLILMMLKFHVIMLS